MANKVIKSANLLPEFLRTDKNTKFLSSTLDQLIQPPQLERIDGYIGSKVTPTYNADTDNYIPESLEFRRDYQLEPALIIKDNLGTVSDVIGFDDISNEIATKGGKNNNLDRLFRSEFYSYNPHIDWDKLVNYQQYYWLVTGPETIVITVPTNTELDVSTIVGCKTYSFDSGVTLSNGMKIQFSGSVLPEEYQHAEFFVEGVGTAIKLINFSSLSPVNRIATTYDESFDAVPFDDYPFDSFKRLPLDPEYVTINRASRDLNSWSQYNRWVHADIITASAFANNVEPVFPASNRAQRPIIEFNADLQLFNFGSIGSKNIDLIDTTTLDAFSTVSGSSGYYVDGVLLQQGHRVIFNADTDAAVCGKVFIVNYVTISNILRLQLSYAEDHTPLPAASLSVMLGNANAGTTWWYAGDGWMLSQQHTTLNQAPLFDLFDNDGNSYADKTIHLSNFTGNKIFGYDVGTTFDSVLKISLKYKNSAGVGSFLFKNYFMTDSFSVAENNQATVSIPTSITYCKFSSSDGATYANVWKIAEPHPMTTTQGFYDLPLGLTNNPLNGPIDTLTLGELSDHLNTMIQNMPQTPVIASTSTMFVGTVFGGNNLRDIGDVSSYGTRLISNANPMVFSQLFIGKKEHSIVDAVSKAGDQYNQFKMALLKNISTIVQQSTAPKMLDTVLIELNQDKDLLSPYYLSDMIAYGTDKISKSWTVTRSRNVIYSIASDFDPTALGTRSVLVYLNGAQLLLGTDYEFIINDSSIKILTALTAGDILTTNDYFSTEGSHVPPTPTKLGLYPKFLPSIFVDNTYIDAPVTVIQGHDGSIMAAYNDFRDLIVLEFESRIYNNIKSFYNAELFDINSVMPGAFRDTQYSQDEITEILQRDFIKWAGFYGIDYTVNSSFDEANQFTWNYRSGYNNLLSTRASGSWRAIYKYFYGTDRPHTHPWEMLGITEQPSWWITEYGSAPYTSGNTILWNDIEQGVIRFHPPTSIDLLYARPGLSNMLPVDTAGNLIAPGVALISNVTAYNRRQSWKFGDQGPAETAWRRSSYWPFAVQRLLALTKPATYAALMYDPSRLTKNIAAQWTYGTDHKFLNPKSVAIYDDARTLTSGYSVYVVEIGRQRTTNYIQELKQDIAYIDFNLFHKVGGFVSKNKLQIIIDAYAPTSTSAGALLPPENYDLILNTSNPVKSVGISGLIIQKVSGKFVIKGYDKFNPYFSVHAADRNANTAVLVVGGISESYVIWGSDSAPSSTLSAVDMTTAVSSSPTKFYQAGQIVSYNGRFYRVKVSHAGESTFNPIFYQLLSELPQTGGATVQTVARFSSAITHVPYGTEYTRLQEVYDLIMGYGKWLTNQGFIFDEYNTEFNAIIDWNFTAKEFLYWTTQNWADNSVITLSPFANQIKYAFANSVVDNIFDSFYEYSILQANGVSMPREKLNVTRQDSVCTISAANPNDGIYFAELHSVQKEHAMVFDNITVFNDTIYDIETGYRQRRMKLSGFRTANWDGDFFSPGFIYDTAVVTDWTAYANFQVGRVVRYASLYYSAIGNVTGTAKFDFTKWVLLGEKPLADLLPNFDYKINQFEDFYSLDIDNFDAAQQKMAQHLVGYTPRVYLDNIFTNPIAQYKFYQGFIKEKGTKNAIDKLAKASIHNLQGELFLTEEWAFRVGSYGSYTTYQELEVPLIEGTFVENPQVINFVNTISSSLPNDLTHYSPTTDLVITPDDYNASTAFAVESSTLLDNNFKLTTAGFVRFDDVTSTAYSENSLLDIANNGSINEGDTIWMGFKQDGTWDVLRYNLESARITGAFVNIPAVDIIFVLDTPHNLSIGDVVSVANVNSQVNGVYLVKDIPSDDQFSVTSALVAITDEVLAAPGLLFKFASQRYETFDALPSDQELLKLPVGVKFWINDNGAEKWVVYQKIKNYSTVLGQQALAPIDQKLGWSISKRPASDIVVVGAPRFYEPAGEYGEVYVYDKTSTAVAYKFKYTINAGEKYHTPGYPTEFGFSVIYDIDNFNNTGYGLIFAGAPATSYTKSIAGSSGVRVAASAGIASALVEEGLVKISSVNPLIVEERTELVLLSPAPASHARFGASMYVSPSASIKLMLIGAPSTVNTGTGAVYAYQVASTNVVSVTMHPNGVAIVPFRLVLTTGAEWGYSISGSDDASVIAISAPGYLNNTGIVQIFNGVNFEQTISSPFAIGNRFGEVTTVSANGKYIFISSTESDAGKVAVYTRSATGAFVLEQILVNPVADSTLRFGYAIASNSTADIIVISSVGTNSRVRTTFDTATGSEETFDIDTTKFFDTVPHSGTVYVYNRKHTRFVLAEELAPVSAIEGTDYGYSVAIDTNSVYVGAPADTITTVASAFYTFVRIDASSDSLKTLRLQDDLVSINVVQRAILIDAVKEEVVEYLDIIDPLKGRISGIADQELKFKSQYDPAVYSIGITGTTNDPETSWVDDHVGELWWDLSTVKYVWYEQGELSYRKNNWGTLFPGATIDIYEWVSSEYMPSEWSRVADTAQGLTEGISGQPKFSDNSVISVKQVYSAVSNSFSNVYYFWVKNKVTLPPAKNRRTSSYQVASIISAPTIYGLKFAAIISKDAVAISNIGSMLVDTRIHLNIASDTIDSAIPRHTEWLLLQEGAAQSVPNVLLEKKLIDSLLGHDSLGQPVPDLFLTDRTRYGVGIRPRQTLFKDRIEALRNVVEFSNSILINEQITGNYSFANLNKQELISDIPASDYDQIVEDNESLLIIDKNLLSRAEALPILSCTVANGRLRSVTVDHPGSGYVHAPSVKITSATGSSAEITTEINSLGQIISATIVASGNGFVSAPVITVRPYTVLVQVDSAFNNQWTKFILDTSTKTWVRIHTQQYNTALYWKYVDWQHTSYNQFIDYTATVDAVYLLDTLPDLMPGQYVKVKNGGDGNYIILEKSNSSIIDIRKPIKFSNNFNLVFKQNGTIQILDSIWDSSKYGFDQSMSYDQSLYSQTPDLELQFLLTALKSDLFIGALKVNWNLFFFKAVKYALSEQKLLDWAFKTSFVTVTNRAGTLDQRPVYKLQNSKYFEDYLKEVKPYHTNIRRFVTGYEILEPASNYITDFDLPAVYNSTDATFETVNLGDPLLDSYPWKSWNDNYLFEVGSISVGVPGDGYTQPPTVTIVSAPGDLGVGATATAYIRSGSVISIIVTNKGMNYKTAPSVVIAGGGSVTIPAFAYARLFNGKVRTNKINIKFDRTSRTSQINNDCIIDTFTCNGSNTQFVLSWLAEPNKNNIVVTLNGDIVLRADYTISYYKEPGIYTTNRNKLVFLSGTPSANQILTVQYVKNINLMNATDRILNYYIATSGMPGNDLSQLMTGIEYAGRQLSGLALDYSTNWDANPFGKSSWADDVSYYSTATFASTSTAGTSTVALNEVSLLSVGQYANIISTITNMFSTTDEVLITSIDTATNLVTFSSTLSGIVRTGSTIEFWSGNSPATMLDTIIDSGNWNGIATDAISIDGSTFINPESSYAPEELLDGFIAESIGINVYTKNQEGAPIVLSNNFTIAPSTSTSTIVTMSIVPPTSANIAVVFDNKILTYTTATTFTTSTQFSINWATNQLIIPPQLLGGKVGYTIVSIGGGQETNTAGVIDNTFAVTTMTSVQLQSVAIYGTVNSAYVTVNGEKIESTPSDIHPWYVLTFSSPRVFGGLDNNRAAVTVVNLPEGTSAVHAWFFGFGSTPKYFNEIKEQTISVGQTSTATFTLTQAPGNIEPAAAQAIVEIIDANGRRRLTPPPVSYYEIANINNRSFIIDNNRKHDAGTFTIDNVKAYVNGIALRTGYDFTINSDTNSIIVGKKLLTRGDVVAVVGLVSGEYEFNITGATLRLASEVSNVEIKVLTYTDHDDLLMRTESFPGVENRRYKISRQVLDDNYIWVQLNGIPLIARVDYEILDDRRTVQISDAFRNSSIDSVVITSIGSQRLSATVLGYRIFTDIFNRTHFKRLSGQNTTYLTRPLRFADDIMYINNVSVLTPPLLAKKIPGIVLIDGERIEFFKIGTDAVYGDFVSQLRRGTLGTASREYTSKGIAVKSTGMYPAGSTVMDQSPEQTIPFSETRLKQRYITTSSNANYIIHSTATTGVGNGITFLSDTTVAAADQVAVYYGGRLLRKSGEYYQDVAVAFDSPIANILGSVPTELDLPATYVLGDAYIVTATNQVWAFTAAPEIGSPNRYIYSGLNYLEPEFSIVAASGLLTLNIASGVQAGIELVIIKREAITNSIWNDINEDGSTVSLMQSTTAPARFIQARPAELPDKYYYGNIQ